MAASGKQRAEDHESLMPQQMPPLSLSLSLSPSLSPSLSLPLSSHSLSLSHSRTHTHTHKLSLSLSLSLTLAHTHTLTHLRQGSSPEIITFQNLISNPFQERRVSLSMHIKSPLCHTAH